MYINSDDKSLNDNFYQRLFSDKNKIENEVCSSLNEKNRDIIFLWKNESTDTSSSIGIAKNFDTGNEMEFKDIAYFLADGLNALVKCFSKYRNSINK